jgi:hypothetical protein
MHTMYMGGIRIGVSVEEEIIGGAGECMCVIFFPFLYVWMWIAGLLSSAFYSDASCPYLRAVIWIVIRQILSSDPEKM